MADSEGEAWFAESDLYHDAKRIKLQKFAKSTVFGKYHLNNSDNLDLVVSFLHSCQDDIINELLKHAINDLLMETDEKKELRKLTKRIKEIVR